MGIDLAKIKYIFILVAFIAGVIGVQYAEKYFANRLEDVKKGMNFNQQESEDIRGKLEEYRHAKDIIDEFNKQIAEVRDRMDRVNKVMRSRTNPNIVLEQIALSTASDVWLTGISVDKERNISIFGNSKTYKGMGDFLNNLNKYSSFGNGLRIESSLTKELAQSDGNKVRIEEFKISGVIRNYESF